MKRAEEPRLIGQLFQSPNSNDRNVPGSTEATFGVLLLAPERVETYHVIVVIVNLYRNYYIEITHTFSDNASLGRFLVLSHHVKYKQNSVSRTWIFQHYV